MRISSIPVEMDISSLAEVVSDEEAVEIIKELDKSRADWEFTLGIAKYFVNEIVCQLDDPDYTNELRKLLGVDV